MKKGPSHLLRRTLSTLLVCALLFTLLPTAALAVRRSGYETPVDETPAEVYFEPGEGTEVSADFGPVADLAAAGPRTYYVSLSGKGGNNGLSEDKPLPGLDAVPWDQLAGGDSVLLKKGDVFPGIIRLVGVQGQPGKPITIGAYGAESAAAPVIESRGQGIWLQETGSTAGVGKYASSGILLYDCAYITVEGIDVSNRPDPLETSYTDISHQHPSADVENYASVDRSGDKLAYSGVAVAADGKAAAEGIVLRDITVHGDSDVRALIAETSSVVDGSGVTKGTEAPVRTYTTAEARAYYVSSLNGSDSNDGSDPNHALYSLHKINELDLQPGTKVYLERGSVFENQYLHLEGGGSDADPVIIDAYGSSGAAKPQINTNGNGVWYQNYRYQLDSASHLTHGYVSSSVLLYDVSNVEIKNIALSNFGRYGETPGADFANLGSYDGGTVPGETGYNTNGNIVGTYTWGGKMCRTGVAGVAQNKGTVHHTVLQNLDIENVYGHIAHKHMNNGGIYFTAARPLNEAVTGIAKFDDVRIEGCYLDHVSRWGIAVAHTTYWCELSPNTMAVVPDEACQTYGATNVYIGHNFLNEVGGDPITLMHAYEPLVEYNVSQNGGREMSNIQGRSYYMNGTYPNGRGDVSAGIWPWKCKTALFEHNECYTMLYARVDGGVGNNDCQAWDADYGDSTTYQYNYSAGNTGGCIMFCAGKAYNTTFRYNISYHDGMPGNDRGVIDMSSNPNGQIYNNTFVLAKDTLIHRGNHSGNAQVENNIFVNSGEPYDPLWHSRSVTNADGTVSTTRFNLKYNNNVYAGFTGGAENDPKAIVAEKSAIFAVPTFAGAPTAPANATKNGLNYTKSGVRNWARDWETSFNMFKLKEDESNPAINAGLAYNYTGLTQDSEFGVPRVANDKDFYGSALDEVRDMGAHDTLTAGGAGNQLLSSLYELRNTTELHVPFTANNPLTVAEFIKGLTVSAGATVKVYSGTTEQASTANVAADMTVKIVAGNGAESATVYTIKNKNTYNHGTDWVNNQQGNVWFTQYRLLSDGQFYDWSGWTSYGNSGWYEGSNNAVAEPNHAGDDVASDPASRKYIGSGYTFRAPQAGMVTVSFATLPQFRTDRTSSKDNQFDTYLIIYYNGEPLTVNDREQKFLVPKAVAGESSRGTAQIPEFSIALARNDTLSFMVVNEGDTRSFNSNNNGVTFNPVVTYKDEALSETPPDTKNPTAPMGLRATAIGDTTATLAWEASTDNVGVDHYVVKVDDNAEERVNETRKALSGLSPDTSYTATVKAVDAAGNESGTVSITFTTAKTRDTGRPSDVTGAQVVGSPTDTTATISWTAATDNVGVDHYEITVDGETLEVRNATQVTLTKLTASKAYTASIKAVDAAGNKSENAAEVNFNTAAAAAVTAPGEPDGLAVYREVPRESTTVRWFAAEGGSPTVSYKVQVGSGEKVTVNDTTYTFPTPEVKTEYTVTVWAVGETGLESTPATLTFTTQGSGEKALVSSIFEVRDNAIQVPFTAKNPCTVAELKDGVTVSENATVKVYNGSTEVTDDATPVTADMTLRIVAENLSVSAPYAIAQKNTYNHYNDWIDKQQGNVWFAQYRNADGFHDWPVPSGNDNWYGGANPHYASAERICACDDVRAAASRTYQGSGFTFRAPVEGIVEVSFGGFAGNEPLERGAKYRRGGNTSSNGTTYLTIMLNGEVTSVYNEETGRAVDQKIEIKKGADCPITEVPNFKLSVSKGDNIQFMIVNEGGSMNQAQVLYNPVLTYLDEAYIPAPTGISLDESEVTLYTNTKETAERKHTIQLNATVTPADASDEVLWESGDTDVVTVDQNGLVTAVGDGNTVIRARLNSGLSNPGANQDVTCQFHVYTRMESITVKKGDDPIGETITLYTNEGLGDAYPHTVTLTAETVPEEVTHPALNWTRPDGATGKIAINRSEDSCTLTATENELDVGAVKVQVASAEHSDVKTVFTVWVVRKLENNVTISGTAKFGKTLTADLNQLSMSDDGKAGLSFKWYRTGEDGVKTQIEGAASQTYTLTEDDIGTTISVDVIADPDTFYEGTRSATMGGTVKLADNDEIPTDLTATDSERDEATGVISGLDSTKKYEYQAEGASDWTEVRDGAETIEGLAAGNYRVRFAATDTHAAGTNAATVSILTAGVTAYEITAAVDPADSGVVELSASRAEAGTEITVTVTAKPGYRLTALTATSGEPAEEITVTDGKFIMPEANVTVTATFETVPMLTLTHELTHIFCDQEDNEHKVEYGGALTIHLTAEDGYTMPEHVTVKKSDGSAFTAFRYSRTSETEATIIFTGEEGITEDLTIIGEGEAKSWKVNYTLTNGLSAPSAARDVKHKAAYSGKLETADNYALPDSIVITMGGSLLDTEKYTYLKEDGTITIPEGIITGNLVITANGVDTRVPVVSVTGVTLNRTTASVAKNSTLTLVATVAPANATNKGVVWASSNPEIASVDMETGKVTGVAEGLVTITVTTLDGLYAADCEVTVTAVQQSQTSTGSSSSTSTKTEVKDDGTKVTTVTDNRTGTVTETVEQPDGTKSEAVTTKDGDVTITVTDPEGEELAKVELPAEIPAPETKFEDLETVPWAENAINNVAGLELVKGSGDNKYEPTAPMTRGALATVLHRLSQGKSDYEVAFKDVAQNKYYTEGVAWAAKAKVVTGYTSEIFAPNDIITREQLAVMLARYAKLIGMDTSADSKALDQFADGGDTGRWAVNGVAWCVEQGLMKGRGQNTLDPTAEISRAEVAVLLDRFLGLLK